jgi:putative sterol carrier protein
VKPTSLRFATSLVKFFNDDEESASASADWRGDFGIEVRNESAFYVGAPGQSGLPLPVFLSADELRLRNPTYYASATRSDFRALLLGELDVISAVLEKRLGLTGDLTPVIARMKFRGLLERWLIKAKMEIPTWDSEMI